MTKVFTNKIGCVASLGHSTRLNEMAGGKSDRDRRDSQMKSQETDIMISVYSFLHVLAMNEGQMVDHKCDSLFVLSLYVR